LYFLVDKAINSPFIPTKHKVTKKAVANIRYS